METKFPIRQKTALAIHRAAGRSCFPIFLYQHCRNQKPPTLISLFFLYIFQTVKGYGCQDNDTFKDELKVCINTQNRQRVGQRGKDQYTRYNSGNLTDTTDEGDAADDAGRNGIALIVQAGGLRDGADARALDKAGQTVHHARECVDKDRRAENIHAGDIGSLGIRADGEHVLAERRLVPQEPGDGKQDDGIKHIPRRLTAPMEIILPLMKLE